MAVRINKGSTMQQLPVVPLVNTVLNLLIFFSWPRGLPRPIGSWNCPARRGQAAYDQSRPVGGEHRRRWPLSFSAENRSL